MENKEYELKRVNLLLKYTTKILKEQKQKNMLTICLEDYQKTLKAYKLYLENPIEFWKQTKGTSK